ncbi:MAG TPA: hypothetical protein VLN45_08010 [Ignavibacteriaceae bacterium]|nr:hypothetical protein [Ignavibacteriaceae bacterium]
MKLFIKYLILLVIFSLVNGCDKPAPTELIEDDFEVEVITKDTEDEFYTADSSGVIENLNRFVNIITVSGLKITTETSTINGSYAQAIFFDRNNPVFRNGRLLIYNTRILGDVKFNNIQASLRPFIVRYRVGNNHNEINIGRRHVLNSFIQGEDFNFQYNSTVNFNLDFFPIFGGGSVNFIIPTLSEINGSVIFESNNGNSEAILRWNKENYQKFEIIIGASGGNSEKVFPLFRLKTKDDGELIVPENLINRIPPRFNKLVFTLVRKFESHHPGNNNDLYVLSQSTHSLVVDIP